ncbi:Lrp/AsnC family transcriptional regulator [Vibrio sp.]|uniref:Lrp/AsnC family transcriptional regulator n=1 Tax=Vibrio sp. TaxID=678 RepID=UPI0037BD1CA6
MKSSRLLWRRDRTPTSLIYRRLSPSVSIKSSYLGERLPRRIKRLEEKGIIDGYRVSLSREKVGVAMSVFVEVSLNNHQEVSIDKFEGAIVEMEEVISCHVVSGAYDYLLEVVSPNLMAYEAFTRKLQRLSNVKDIHTHLAIRQVKGNAPLPVYTE